MEGVQCGSGGVESVCDSQQFRSVEVFVRLPSSGRVGVAGAQHDLGSVDLPVVVRGEYPRVRDQFLRIIPLDGRLLECRLFLADTLFEHSGESGLRPVHHEQRGSECDRDRVVGGVRSFHGDDSDQFVDCTDVECVCGDQSHGESRIFLSICEIGERISEERSSFLSFIVTSSFELDNSRYLRYRDSRLWDIVENVSEISIG